MYKNTFGPIPKAELSLTLSPGQLVNQDMIIVAGPCSIESEEQALAIFNVIYSHVTHFRGGVFRAGTYPGKQWGWQLDLLKIYHSLSKQYGKPNVVDVLDIRDLEIIDPYVDVYQVGMRQSQHYALLKELGKQKKPVILKRGSWQKLGEFLGSLEYILQGGNNNVILCERGSVSYLDHVRWELSVSMIAMLKKITKFPVIVDASHGTGNSMIVSNMTLAGIAAGADGCLIETHYDPLSSMSDAEQCINFDQFKYTINKALKIKELIIEK